MGLVLQAPLYYKGVFMVEDKILVPQNDIIDIDLSVTRKKRFRFNKDNNCIVEINTSDMSIMKRLADSIEKLQDLQERAGKIADGLSDTENDATADLKTMSDRLTAVDAEMRSLIDYIFDANVSEKAAPSGSMYDPFDGVFRYEHIINAIVAQFEDNMQSEYRKIEKNMRAHTDKYIKR